MPHSAPRRGSLARSPLDATAPSGTPPRLPALLEWLVLGALFLVLASWAAAELAGVIRFGHWERLSTAAVVRLSVGSVLHPTEALKAWPAGRPRPPIDLYLVLLVGMTALATAIAVALRRRPRMRWSGPRGSLAQAWIALGQVQGAFPAEGQSR